MLFLCGSVFSILEVFVLVERKRLRITGRVQGVGFRPAVYKIACRLGLGGFVYNDAGGVVVELQGGGEVIAKFLDELRSGADRPGACDIKSVVIDDINVVEAESEFVIRGSESGGVVSSEVAADIATCKACLAEMRDEGDFRYKYPFINCTNCGPRYSIVKAVPYDRCNTTMGRFEMCEKCGGQYGDVGDRRFHAQPVACPECGPAVYLTDSNGVTIEADGGRAIEETARLLCDGKIVGIKGVGGFHLAVDAFNDEAVRELRLRKRRDARPFAMMADSVEKIRKYAHVSEAQEGLLTSAQCPIVLLKKKDESEIAESVAEGVGCYGFMLCYAPLQWLLFEHFDGVLIMTSGNVSDEPLIKDNDEATAKLGSIADAFLMHNRDIYRQVDDSIAHVIEGQEVLIRRARGYVPGPIVIGDNVCGDILATGSDLKNTFSLVKGNQLICSEHIGDLADSRVYRHYVESIEHLCGLFEVRPRVIACDLHPNYFSSNYARQMDGVKIIEVQHHWAHIAAVMAENNCRGEVIGLSCDGTGYGTDGAVWGFECLRASLGDFTRLGHLSYFKLAGGDKASKQAIRPMMGLLVKVLGSGEKLEKYQQLLDRIEPDRNLQRVVLEQIEKDINAIETSSLGRVFDAVAAMAGVGSVNSFEAQLPMGLQAVIERNVEDSYDFEILSKEGGFEISIDKMILQVADDAGRGVSAGVIAAKFHNCIAGGLLAMAEEGQRMTGLDTIALSGGVFCNSYLLERTIIALKKRKFKVLYNKLLPANDGCVSVGQAAIAAYTLEGGKFSR
jgi:hydrogenase maturation protein HypF